MKEKDLPKELRAKIDIVRSTLEDAEYLVEEFNEIIEGLIEEIAEAKNAS